MTAITYHYSLKFADCDIPYHGELKTKDTAKNVVVQLVRLHLADKKKAWNKTHSEVVSIEIYTFDGENRAEKEFFKWEKKQ